MHRRRVPRPKWDSLGDSAHFDLCQSSGLKGDTVAGRSLLDPHVDGAVSSAEAARAASKRRAAQKRRRSMQLGRLAMDPAQLEAERLAREAEVRRKRAEDVALEASEPHVTNPQEANGEVILTAALFCTHTNIRNGKPLQQNQTTPQTQNL